MTGNKHKTLRFKFGSIVVVVAIGVLLGVGIWILTRNKKPAQNISEELISEVIYKCKADKQIRASFYAGQTVSVAPGEPPKPTGRVKLQLSDGRSVTLPQTISGSGIRYATADESMIFWSKGDTAFVVENDKETFSGCNSL